MENQTAFDLNQAVQTWRENLANSPAFRRENLNELESHLRDSVAKLETGHLSAEEAFLIASRRIGPQPRLEAEFGKLNRKIIWIDRLLWMTIGLQAWIFINLLSAVPANLMALAWSKTNSHWYEHITLPVVLFATVRVLSLCGSFWFFWWLILRKGSQFSQWLLSKLQRRYFVVGCAIAACLLLVVLQGFSNGAPAYLTWRFGQAVASETSTYLNLSRSLVYLPLLLGSVIFTLSVARKRAMLEGK